jgi:putative transposase
VYSNCERLSNALKICGGCDGRWTLKILPVLTEASRNRRAPWAWGSGTVDFPLTARRDEAARRLLTWAIDQHGRPATITIDKSGANTVAINGYNVDHVTEINLRQCKYSNNAVEQDHRAIKRMTRPMLGFKSWPSARILLAGIETMHMTGRGRRRAVSAAEQFFSLAY